MNKEKDFGQGSVSANILRLAIPMTLAQLINVLYNVVDRIYIGHIPHTSTQALTGIGLTLPVITIITAFANLFGMGGAPLFSMARGADERRTDYGEFFCHAPCIRRSSCCLLLPVQASAPLSFWSKRRDLSICECLY